MERERNKKRDRGRWRETKRERGRWSESLEGGNEKGYVDEICKRSLLFAQ